jgi:hypothetical protein
MAYFGDHVGALESLRLSYKTGATVPVAANLALPVLRPVRQLPEFRQFVREIGLVDYCRTNGWADY